MTTTSTDHRLSMDELAAVIARDIPAGAFVNLGIGQPTKIADHLPHGSGVVLHTENSGHRKPRRRAWWTRRSWTTRRA
ncbi:hypothetical protein AB0958_37375, partial [Streptomyces sp. NPDC006655]